MAEGSDPPTAMPETGSADQQKPLQKVMNLAGSGLRTTVLRGNGVGTHLPTIPGANLAGGDLAGMEVAIVQGGHGTTPGAVPEPTLGPTTLAILIMLLMGQGQGWAQVQMVRRQTQQQRALLVEGTVLASNLKMLQVPQQLRHKSQEAFLELQPQKAPLRLHRVWTAKGVLAKGWRFPPLAQIRLEML